MTTDTLALPDASALKARLSPIIACTMMLTCNTQEELVLCDKYRGIMSDWKREIENFWNPFIAALHAMHKAHIDAKTAMLRNVTDAIGHVDEVVRDYKRVMDDLRREQAEHQAKALQEAVAAGEMPLIKAEPIPVVSMETATFVTRWTFDEDKVDLPVLIAWCAAHPEDSNLLKPNAPAIRARVVSQKQGFNLPGVMAYPVQDIRNKPKNGGNDDQA